MIVMAESPEKSLVRPAHDKAIDKVLEERFNQGEDGVFDRIVEEYSGDISVLANRLLGWPGEVEDVVQSILLAAFLGLQKFRCECSLKTWLFTITINKCRSHRRKRLLRQRLLSKAVGETSFGATAGADQVSMDRERFSRVRRAVMELPAKYREPVVLKYLQELGTDEVIGILGISKNVLEVRLNRARKRLKAELAELIEE